MESRPVPQTLRGSPSDRSPVSSNAVEPGTRLVDRYRLEEHLGEADGTTYWRAQDELLDRPVGVCLLPAADSNAERVLRAARRAAALTDARFLRVLDASEIDDVVYVVSEWVSATDLVDLLADGPLPAGESRQLGLDIAEALGAAHSAGLAHLCLAPEHVLRTAHGQVKLGGLAVDAAVRGLEPKDAAGAALQDTRGAAAVAYAALTGRWPGTETTGLPPAPRDGNGLCSPRQVRAGVPHDLDEVLCRALDVPGHHGSALRTPDELAAALAETHVADPGPAETMTAGLPSYRLPHVSPYDEQAPTRRNRGAWLAWSAVALVLVVGLALAGGQVLTALRGGSGPNDSGSAPSSSPSPSAQATGTKIAVKSVRGFDPEGDGEENDDQAALVTDGDRSTVWISNYYNDPFGPAGLKTGVGLLLDLGSSQTIGSVTVVTVGGATDFEVRAATKRGAATSDYAPVGKHARARDVDGRAVVVPDEPLKARYVLVWLTSLPADGSVYRGRIGEITVRG
jgi:hypothetical protein